jgi:hypothetical protein
LPEKQTTPRRPKQDPPGRLSSDFRIHKLGEKKRKRKRKKKVVGRGKKVFYKTV